MLSKSAIKLACVAALSVFFSNAYSQNVGVNYDGSTPTMMFDVKTQTGGADGIRINHTGATGDPIVNFQLSGSSIWTLGVDDSDLDEFKISRSGALGTTNAFTINSSRQLMSALSGNVGAPSWTFETDPNTGMWRGGTDILAFSAGGSEFLRLIEGATNVAVFNEDSWDMDFRLEGNGQQNLFRLDAGNDRIGIRTGNPSWMFHMINGGINVGAAPMSSFENQGTQGVALTGNNSNTANTYNGIEGVTYGTYTGVMGLGITTGTGGDGVFGTTNDWQSYGVRGSRFNSGGANTGFGGIFFNDLAYTGGFWFVSDKRFKKDIRNMGGALDMIMDLRPVTYNYNTDAYPYLGLKEGMEFGFVAQEVGDVMPNVVMEKKLDLNACMEHGQYTESKKEDAEVLMMDYSRIVPVLTAAMQEQQALIEEMKAELESLRERVNELENQ